jgi:ABC-type transporter Mla MlaB component
MKNRKVQRSALGWRNARPQENKVDRIAFTGDLTDGDAITDLLVKCKNAMKHHARQNLTVDLTNVEAADTKLIAALVILRRWAASVDVELVLHVPRCVQRWLSVCRLESLASTGD